MRLPDYILRQLAKPSGTLGRLILWQLKRVNSQMNTLALDALSIKTEDRVLEIGFGGGELLDEIIRQEPQSVTGVEISQLAIAKARKRFSRAITDGMLDLVPIEGDNLPFEPGAFSKVCCVNVIYFWDDPIAMMSKVHRVLQPDGQFVVCYEPVGPNERETSSDRVEGHLRTVGFREITTVHDRERSSGEFSCTTAAKP